MEKITLNEYEQIIESKQEYNLLITKDGIYKGAN